MANLDGKSSQWTDRHRHKTVLPEVSKELKNRQHSVSHLKRKASAVQQSECWTTLGVIQVTEALLTNGKELQTLSAIWNLQTTSTRHHRQLRITAGAKANDG